MEARTLCGLGVGECAHALNWKSRLLASTANENKRLSQSRTRHLIKKNAMNLSCRHVHLLLEAVQQKMALKKERLRYHTMTQS